MNRSSLRNEGKIHLGILYANDRTFSTAKLMLRGGLSFGRILRGLVGADFRDVGISTPFVYLVAHDSVLCPDALSAHYEQVEAAYRELLSEGGDYLGLTPERLVRRMDETEWRSVFAPSLVHAAFLTEERAIDADDLARVVRAALEREDAIEVLTRHRLDHVRASAAGYSLHGGNPSGPFRLDVDQVINATMERRAAIDRQVGIEPEGDLLHRLKYRVIASLPSNLASSPSATMVLGRYGDVVIRPNGTAFLSWYPAGLRGWTDALEPPRSWDAPCRGEVEPGLRASLFEEIVSAIDSWYPGISGVRPIIVDAGAIVAHGVTDVDDPDSALHERFRVGVRSLDGYHTVEPGKLTTAPLFAVDAARRVLSNLGQRVPAPETDAAAGVDKG